MLVGIVTLATAAALAQAGAPAPCGARTASGIEAFVVMTPIRAGARDTLARATVCVVASSASKQRVASYHGELTFDSTAARVVSVEKPKDGMRVENARRAGSVRFAGASPEGFTDPAYVTVTFRVARPGTSPRARVRMIELNSTDGANLLRQLVTRDSTP